LESAARYASSVEVKDGMSLCSNMLKLVSVIRSSERDFSIAELIGVPVSELAWSNEKIKRGGEEEYEKVLNLPDQFELTAELSKLVIGTWREFDPSESYFRVKAGKYLAIVDLKLREAFFYDLKMDFETELGFPNLIIHPWTRRIEEIRKVA
jgi:hypothetical protein